MASYPTLESLGFPARRSIHNAIWVPIYLEPIVGSGERLCIGVIAVDTHDVFVACVANLERLTNIYGDEANAFVFASEIALRSIENKVNKDGIASLSEWRGRMEGLIFGKIRSGAGESLQDVAQTGLMQCASLLPKANKSPVFETDESIGDPEPTSRRLETLVKDFVVAQRPALHSAFGQFYRASEHARPTRFGFVGTRLAANFGLLVPGRLGPLVNMAKAKLWDLSQLKSGAIADMFPKDEKMEFELLLHLISPQDPQFDERQFAQVRAALLELEEEADKATIRCQSLHSTSEIADHLLRKEAA